MSAFKFELEDFGTDSLGTRCYRALMRENIDTAKKFRLADERGEIEGIRNLGEKCFERMRNSVARLAEINPDGLMFIKFSLAIKQDDPRGAKLKIGDTVEDFIDYLAQFSELAPHLDGIRNANIEVISVKVTSYA